VFAAAGSVDALCFLSLCYNGLRLRETLIYLPYLMQNRA